MLNLFFASLLLTSAVGPHENPTIDSPLFERVVVTGASVSAGYGLRQELEISGDFGMIFAAALRSDKPRVHTHASLSFFADPSDYAKNLLVESLEEEPTLLVALDFLFWFGHGVSASEEARIEHMREGLAFLNSVGCPLVIADLPDMTLSLDGVNPFGIEFMRTDMLPKPETLVALNAEIYAWAKERKHVSVVPLARFMSDMIGEQDVTLRGNEWKGSSKTKILQEDLLHPTLEGNLGLAVLTLDTLAKHSADFCDACVLWKTDDIRARLLERTKKQREVARERDRKREERKRAREEKKQKQEQR